MKKIFLFLVLFLILQSLLAVTSRLYDFCDSWWVGICLKNRLGDQDLYFVPEYRVLKFDFHDAKILNLSKFRAKGDSIFDFTYNAKCSEYPKLNSEILKKLVGSVSCFTFIYEDDFNGYVVFYTLPDRNAIECFIEGVAFYESEKLSLYAVSPRERGFDLAEKVGSLRYVDNFRFAKNSSDELFEQLLFFNYTKDSDAKIDYIEEQITSFAKIKYFAREKYFRNTLNEIRIERIIGEFNLEGIGKLQEEALLTKLNAFSDKINIIEGQWIFSELKSNKKECSVYSYTDRYGTLWFYLGRDKKSILGGRSELYTYKFSRIDFDFDAKLGFCFSFKKYEAPFVIRKGEKFSAKVGASNRDHKYNLKDVFYIPMNGLLLDKNSISCLNKNKDKKLEISPDFTEIKEYRKEGENWVLQSTMKKVVESENKKTEK